MLIDITHGRTNNGGPTLIEVHRIGGQTIRTTVKLDTYQQQSCAVVHVLTPALAWTELAEYPAHVWWRAYSGRTRRENGLGPLSDTLVDRACKILGLVRAEKAPLPVGLTKAQRTALEKIGDGEVLLRRGKVEGATVQMIKTLSLIGLVKVGEGTYDECPFIRA